MLENISDTLNSSEVLYKKKVLPNKNIIRFLREVKFKFNILDKNINEKIREFFECYNVKDVEFNPNVFYNNEDSTNSDDESEDNY